MTLQWVLGWWNLMFLAPFLIAITYLGVYVSTGITFGDGDVDHDVDVDADADHDFDADADADHDLDGDADADSDSDGDHDQESKSVPATSVAGHGLSVLDLLGVGRVPLSLLVMIFLFSWSISGFAAVQWMHQSMSDGATIALYALPIAAFVAAATTSALSRLFGSVIPMREAPAAGLAHLVGHRGVAVLPISDTFGLARVERAGAAGIQVPCRVADGEPTIDAHTTLIVLRHDRAERLFYVTTPDRLSDHRAALPALSPRP